MALSDEQNAMLRLLASGEQGYDDIAALLGLPVAEVRAKVVGALAQLEAEGKPVPDIPPPVPSAAKPAGRAATPSEQVAPAEPAVSEREPAADTSEAPAAAPPAFPPPSDRRSPSAGRTITLPTGRNAWLLGGGVLAAIVVIVVVILLVSGGGGGNGGSTAANEGATAPAAEKGGSEGAAKQPTQAELIAVGGSEAKGLATFGRVKNKLALQVEATGLEPTEEGTNSYTVWLAQSRQKMIPLVSTGVKGSGKAANAIAAEFEVPVEVLAYLANGTFDEIAITRTDDEKLHSAIEAATKAKTTPSYTGEEVLRGTISGPIVGLAKREEEQKKEEGE